MEILFIRLAGAAASTSRHRLQLSLIGARAHVYTGAGHIDHIVLARRAAARQAVRIADWVRYMLWRSP